MSTRNARKEPASPDSIPMLRRFVAFALVFAVSAMQAESVFGALRDGEVHHESGAQALSHSSGSHGDHGHEDGPLSHQHGDQHQHGTAADHCTHQHSTAAPAAALALAYPPVQYVAPLTPPPAPAGGTLAAPFHPPRA